MRKSALITVVAAYLATIGAFWVSDRIFERLPQLEDELAYLYQARLFAQGDVYIKTPEPKTAFWQPFLIDCDEHNPKFEGLDCDGKRFGKYPPGWPLLLASGVKFHLEWALNPFLLLLAVALTYRLAREIFDERVGMVAALLLAASPMAILQSATLMSHPAALFFTLLCLYGLWRLERGKGAQWWGMMAGMALGMVVAIRPLTGLGLAAPLVAYSLLRVAIGLCQEFQYRRISRHPLAERSLMSGHDTAINTRASVPTQDTKLAWWWQLFIVNGLLAVGTGAALWASAEMNWQRWPVLLVGVTLVTQTTYFYAFKSETASMVNPGLPRSLLPTTAPLFVTSVFALLIGGLWPAFNYMTVGNATKNLYELIWPYDSVGFGDGHGRYEGRELPVASPGPGYKIGWHTPMGHNWERARNTLRNSVQCYSRDLFGWVQQPDQPPPGPPHAGNDCLVDSRGLSWVLLPFGFILGWRRRWLWLLALVTVAVIFVTMTYWIGHLVFSARYYYETTAALAIISAVGIVGLADLVKPLKLQAGIYILLAIAIAVSLIGYTPQRIQRIQGYGILGRYQIEAVNQWRSSPDKPVLIIAYGDIPWRQVGALMALTSPYLDSEYVLARDPRKDQADALIEMFPERDVVFYFDGQFVPSRFGWLPQEDSNAAALYAQIQQFIPECLSSLEIASWC